MQHIDCMFQLRNEMLHIMNTTTNIAAIDDIQQVAYLLRLITVSSHRRTSSTSTLISHSLNVPVVGSTYTCIKPAHLIYDVQRCLIIQLFVRACVYICVT